MLLTRRADFAPSTYDAEAGTVDVVWSTGAGVRRRDAAGAYTEFLSLAPEAVDLSRLIGASVLDSHKDETLERVLGVVLDARVDGREGVATIKFSTRPEIAGVRADVANGVLRHVSVGYVVSDWRDGKDATGTRTRTAVRWQPREISFVAQPADPGASVRNEEPMTTVETAAPEAADRAGVNAEIRKLADLAKLDRSVADELIDAGADVATARAAMFDRMVAQAPVVRHHVSQVGVSGDDPEVKIERMSEALHARVDGTVKPSEAARQYVHRRLVDLAAELLEARGERTRHLGAEAILSRAMHTTSDFPLLLTGTGNRVLLAAYQAAPNPMKMLARQTTVNDFRSKSMLKLSEWPRLEEVGEHGEIHYGTRGESAESYRLKTFARLFSLTRNAIINDDLGAFTDFGRAAGQAAAETEASELVALLTANSNAGATLADGNPLFHTSHNNLDSTPATITVDSLDAARKGMRAQVGLDGVTKISVAPRYLLTSPDKETAGQQIVASITPAVVEEVNPFAGNLIALTEPRLSGNGWYVFSDPAQMACLEYAYLSSAQGPQLSTREGWDVLGLEMRCVLDFGCGVIEHRAAWRNPGA